MNWNILLHEKVKKLSKTTCALSKGLSSQVKGLPSSQIWNDLSIKKNNYTALMYMSLMANVGTLANFEGLNFERCNKITVFLN